MVVSVGEVLVDFVSTRTGSLMNSAIFVKKIGGEAANVAVGLAKLGTHSVFIGKVGADTFGRFLVRELRRHQVDVRNIVFDEEYKTRLAFVALEKSGHRNFEFWEKKPAGVQLKLADINLRAIKKSCIVNIAPLLLTREPGRTTAFRVAMEAVRRGAGIAFDANVRPALWRSSVEARRVMLQMIKRCTIVRLNNEEARFLTGERDVQTAATKLRRLGARLVAVTLGASGCYFQTRNAEGFASGFKVRATDTTGCGDAFFAALLHGIARSGRLAEALSVDELTEICLYANAVGALTSLKRGGADAIPSRTQAARFLQHRHQS
jgi:fructokinase